MAKVKILEQPKQSLLPETFDSYSMVRLHNQRYAVVRTRIENGKAKDHTILFTEEEKQFAQERFKILTFQEGMSDR